MTYALTFALTISAAFAASVGNAQTGGLDFGNSLVAENLVGYTPTHTQEASLRPGRVAAETDPGRVRSGQSSIRLQVQPGDCSARIGGGQPDDCASGNERVEINGGPSSGMTFYGFSLMLGSDFRSVSSNAPVVSLVQWFQGGAGACFGLQHGSDGRLTLRNRCTDGRYNTTEPEDVALRASPIDEWTEFVVLANWSKGADGLFRVLVNGQLAYDYRGPTLALEGAEEVSQRFNLLRFDALGRQTSTSTAWIDDAVQSRDIDLIEARYAFDRSTLGIR